MNNWECFKQAIWPLNFLAWNNEKREAHADVLERVPRVQFSMINENGESGCYFVGRGEIL